MYHFWRNGPCLPPPQFWMLCVCISFSEMSRVFQELPEACPHLLMCKAGTGPCSLRAPDLDPLLTGNFCPELWEQCLLPQSVWPRFQNFKDGKWHFCGRLRQDALSQHLGNTRVKTEAAYDEAARPSTWRQPQGSHQAGRQPVASPPSKAWQGLQQICVGSQQRNDHCSLQ